ncbi:hypothetical protein ACP70R_019437 [Stipagrostis hirtigluma subsp. patula]
MAGRAAGRGGRPLLGGSGGVGGGKRGGRPSTAIVAALLLAGAALLLLLMALGALSLPGASDGAGRGAGLARPRPRFRRSAFESGLEMRGEKGEPWTEVLSWEPRAFVYHNFLSKEECEYLISLAKPHMKKSTVVDSATGGSKDSRVRTSSGMFLRRGQDKVIRTIEKRIADYTFIPAVGRKFTDSLNCSENGEGLQVLHYEVGQKYEPHFDYFHDDFNTKNGGQRIATLLMYLSDVEEGGETVFPSATVNSSSSPFSHELSECAKKGLSVKPKMGDALLFWSMKPDGSLDPTSLHGGCPVIKGDKWSSTKWMRVHEYKV